jgi:signal transduction histidine kinase
VRERDRLGLGGRLFAAIALVVVTGAGTLLVVSLLVAPAVFMNHLNRSGATEISGAVRTHVNRAFTQATLISLGAGTLAAVIAAGLVTWLVSRRLAAPVTELAAVTTRLADGVYDADVPDPHLGPEFASLAVAVSRLSERLSTSEAVRRRLMSDLGHELRTPIASLEATVEAMSDGVLPIDEHTLGTLTEQVARLHRLVTDLESVSRAEERQLALNPQPTSLAVLARRAVDVLAPQFRAAAVEWEVESDDPGPVVRVDGDRIVEALLNVLDNAVRHTPAGGVVRVHVLAADGLARVEVVDTGEGFPPEQASLLFQRFYQGTGHDTRPSVAGSVPGRHGSGIGLTIANAIAEAHGGTMSADSDGSGRGATFVITLPQA